MEDLSFIWLKTSKELAWQQNPFEVATLDFKGQIQLKPYDPQPYIQTTQSQTDLILLSDYEVFIDHCGDLYDITDHVELIQGTDQNNVKQIRMQIAYLPYDFGTDLVSLLIRRFDEFIEMVDLYSNPFLLTNYQIEKTTRIDYKYPYTFTALSSFRNLHDSIRLQLYPNNYVSATEIDNYYQISKGQNVISRVNKDRRLQWCFEGADEWHFKRLEEALYNSPCYFNQIRQYPVENLAYEERLADSNISENMIITDPNNNDFLNIIEVIIGQVKVPMLASSSQVCSSSQLVSEIETVL